MVSLGQLAYSKATANPARVVLAVGGGFPGPHLAELAALSPAAPAACVSAPSTPS